MKLKLTFFSLENKIQHRLHVQEIFAMILEFFLLLSKKEHKKKTNLKGEKQSDVYKLHSLLLSTLSLNKKTPIA
jgi:hypothetical protein